MEKPYKKFTPIWKTQERTKEPWHIAKAGSKMWIEKEKGEPWHKSLHGKKPHWKKWKQEELREPWHK